VNLERKHFVREPAKRARLQPRFFAFCDRKSGAVRFQVEAAPDGCLPVDQAATLLALHCVASRQRPEAFQVLVGVQEDLLTAVVEYTEQLLALSPAIRSPVNLSRREREVLRGVMEDLANKEIAARLNLSERTVKFHVSALLRKFRVRSRAGLAGEAAKLLSHVAPFHQAVPPESSAEGQQMPATARHTGPNASAQPPAALHAPRLLA